MHVKYYVNGTSLPRLSFLSYHVPQLREEFMNDMEWYPSFENDGRDNSVQPCAKPGCSPWPTCCQVDLLNDNIAETQQHFNSPLWILYISKFIVAPPL